MLKQYCKEFGLGLTLFIGTTRLMSRAHVNKKIIGSYSEVKNKVIEKWLHKNYSQCIERNFCMDPYLPNAKPRIFVFWWQGEENAPEIVKVCIESIRKKSNMEVVCLSKENYSNYVSMPSYITEKVRNGKMGFAHFSDILRFALLYKWGGVWVDSTCFMTSSIGKDVFEYSFYSLNGPYRGLKGLDWKWTSFYMAAKPGDVLCHKMLDFYYCYWKEHDCVITYLILDCWLTVLSKKCPAVQDEIEKLPKSSDGIFTLNSIINEPLNMDKILNTFGSAYLHKLTYKTMYYRNIDGQRTNWEFILEHENFNACKLES